MELDKHLKVISCIGEPALTEIEDETGEMYLDGEKICKLLCVSGRTLLRLCKAHRINSKRVAHRCYYPLSEIEKLFISRSICFEKVIRERLREEFKRLKEQK